MTYSVQRSTHPLTDRPRWAVLHRPTGTLYFPDRHNKTDAVRLMQKLKNT